MVPFNIYKIHALLGNSIAPDFLWSKITLQIRFNSSISLLYLFSCVRIDNLYVKYLSYVKYLPGIFNVYFPIPHFLYFFTADRVFRVNACINLSLIVFTLQKHQNLSHKNHNLLILFVYSILLERSILPFP